MYIVKMVLGVMFVGNRRKVVEGQDERQMAPYLRDKNKNLIQTKFWGQKDQVELKVHEKIVGAAFTSGLRHARSYH
jgi:hypothetical protein